MEQAREAGLLSDEHFTVDGTLIESWASLKSFRPKDDPPSSTPKGRNEDVDYRVTRTIASARRFESGWWKSSAG
jgi:hypothetical protein